MPRSPDKITGYLRTALRTAADGSGAGGLDVVYQPEYDLTTSTIVAVEALARWEHDALGMMDPGEFIALAEESELILELGSWVIETAFTEFAVWNAQLPGLDVVLRINMAIAQLVRDDLLDTLTDALTRHHVEARQVCIEITESAPRPDPGSVADAVRGLRRLGVHVAIDDLASGYSTLSMLRSLPIDTVKIDRSLITGVDADPRAAAIVRAVVGLAGELGVTLVAEGIETEAERDTLVALGCRRGQGYLLSVPRAGAEIVRVLDSAGQRRPQPRR